MSDDRRSLRSILIPLIVFGVAFGYLEAAVVIYIRRIFFPEGFRFPILVPPNAYALVELLREAATLIMLWAAASLAGRSRWERFGWFAFLFGVWDVVFYAGLFAVLRWPESLLTWDILFLIPLVWAGPVLAPLLVSVLLVSGGAALAVRKRRGRPVRVRPFDWALGAAGVLLMLGSFMTNHGVLVAGGIPERFPWAFFVAGWLAAAGAGVRVLRTKQ
ncbi:MAG: hypothetical protein JW958_05435 [Candidatus Eisenbacteria bacterium]|nr:hypothetical protein [Candidatus Eisenbacteria bacterium]